MRHDDIPGAAGIARTTVGSYNHRGHGHTRAIGGDGIDNRTRELAQLAERFAESMGHQFDERFDFTPDSLSILDGSLRQWLDFSETYRGDNPEEVLSMALPLAAYVGEVMRRNLPRTEWVTAHEEGQIATPHIRVGGSARVNVMKKSIEILTRADSPSFAAYYQAVSDLAADLTAGGSPE